jgi:hypothetical protein
MKKNQWHLLFQGELSDAPGRNETWTEELCYLGQNKWLLRSIGTDFSGTSEGETFQEEMDTNSLLERIIDFDGYDLESSSLAPFFDIELTQVIGSRTIRLRELAIKYKLTDCVDKINKRETNLISELIEDDEYDLEEKITEEQLAKVENKIAILKPYRKIIDAWVLAYIKLNPVKEPQGKARKWGGSRKKIQYREVLTEFLENYVIQHSQLPTGIHIVPNVDAIVRGENLFKNEKPIGAVNFDELELKAKD